MNFCSLQIKIFTKSQHHNSVSMFNLGIVSIGRPSRVSQTFQDTKNTLIKVIFVNVFPHSAWGWMFWINNVRNVSQAFLKIGVLKIPWNSGKHERLLASACNFIKNAFHQKNFHENSSKFPGELFSRVSRKLHTYLNNILVTLTHLFPMHPFAIPENTRKP